MGESGFARYICSGQIIFFLKNQTSESIFDPIQFSSHLGPFWYFLLQKIYFLDYNAIMKEQQNFLFYLTIWHELLTSDWMINRNNILSFPFE